MMFLTWIFIYTSVDPGGQKEHVPPPGHHACSFVLHLEESHLYVCTPSTLDPPLFLNILQLVVCDIQNVSKTVLAEHSTDHE